MKLNYKLKNIILTVIVILMGASGNAFAENLYIFPQPQKTKILKAEQVVPKIIDIVSPVNPTPVEKYTLEEMKNDLFRNFGIKAGKAGQKVTKFVFGKYDSAHVKAALKEINCKIKPGQLRSEGYCLFTRGETAVVAGTDDNGTLYGTNTLLQLLRKKNDKLYLSQVSIMDFPVIKYRIQGWMPCYGYNVGTGNYRKFFEHYAKLRYNYINFLMYREGNFFFNPPKNEKEAVKKLSAFFDDVHQHGIKVIIAFSYLNTCKRYRINHFSPRDQKAVKIIQDAIRLYCMAGADGFMINFDDITQNNVEAFLNHPDHKVHKDTLAKNQLLWLQIMKSAASGYGKKLFSFCPPVYFDRTPEEWSKRWNNYDGNKYLKNLLASPELEGIPVYHTVFTADGRTLLKKYGLKNFAWWYNMKGGSYFCDNWINCKKVPYKPVFQQGSRGSNLFAGFTDPRRGWCCLGYIGDSTGWFYKPTKEVDSALRKMPEWTQLAYVNSHLYEGSAVMVPLLWNPIGFNAKQSEISLAARVFGPNAVDTYLRWRERIRPLVMEYNKLSPWQNGAEKKFLKLQKQYQEVKKLQNNLTSEWRQFEKQRGFEILNIAFSERIVLRLNNMGKTLDRLFVKNQAKAKISPVRERKHGNKTEYLRSIYLENPEVAFNLPWAVLKDKDGNIRSTGIPSAGLGMRGPSRLNWIQSGFFNLTINGISLGNVIPQFKAVFLQGNNQGVEGKWELPDADVRIVFSITPESGLLMDGTVVPHCKRPHIMEMKLIAIPAGPGSSNKWKKHEMDKHMMSSERTLGPGALPYVHLNKEYWFLFYDKLNDYPHAFKGVRPSEGPCAFVMEPENVQWMHINNGTRLMFATILYQKGTTRFRYVFFDLNKTKNADAILFFKENGNNIFEKIRYQKDSK